MANTSNFSLRQLYSNPVIGSFFALLLACTFFNFQSERFLTGQNFSLILQQVMVIGVMAIGQTLVILTSGIDLSCGMIMAFGTIVMAKLSTALGLPPFFAILCGIAACMLIGTLNGLLVTKVNLPPFIVTLGMLNIVFAMTQLLAKGHTVSGLPDGMMWLGETFRINGTSIVYGGMLMLVLYLLTWLFLRDTAPGRHIYAVGDNPEAAHLTGIATKRVLLYVYAASGFFYGLAAMLSVARMGVGDPAAGQTDNLDSITAVVIGGTSLFGGRGIILGTLIGVLIVGVFRNGLTLMGVPSVYQILVTGILVILAVTVDQLTKNKRA